MYSSTFDRKTGDRGLTSELWKGINTNTVDPRYGMFRFDDFTTGRLVDDSSGTGTFITKDGVYVHTVATASDGLASIDTASGGIGAVKLDAETAVAGEGLTLTGTGSVVPVAGRDIVIETRLKFSQAGTVTQFLFGLVNSGCTAPLTGGATLVVNTTNVTDACAVTNVLSNAPTASLYAYNDEAGESAEQSSSAIDTIAASTYYKWGIRIFGTSRVEYWADGEKVYTFTPDASNSVPTVALSPIFAVQSDDGSTTANVIVDWLAIGQTPLALT